ncbi:MAG TPA: type II toxin-antitoxin system RelE/ParE family toxin [Phycisphaerae bacterium]|jgi:plasmid stabilization system protein ParE
MKREIVRWPRVGLDLTEYYENILRDKVQPAEKFLKVAEEAFERIAMFPGIGLLWPGKRNEVHGVRCYPMPAPYRSYVIFYRVKGSAVEIMAIEHGAKNLQRIVDVLLK